MKTELIILSDHLKAFSSILKGFVVVNYVMCNVRVSKLHRVPKSHIFSKISNGILQDFLETKQFAFL